MLHAHAVKTGVRVFGYCFMPDHVHLVLGPSPECDIITFVAQYRNLAQRAAWKLGVRGGFWQKRFWDHFLRSEEKVENLVQYVLDNPVRKMMADDWNEYPFSGSLVFPIRRDGEG